MGSRSIKYWGVLRKDACEEERVQLKQNSGGHTPGTKQICGVRKSPGTIIVLIQHPMIKAEGAILSQPDARAGKYWIQWCMS